MRVKMIDVRASACDKVLWFPYTSIHQILNIARALIPMTPPPRPSHPLISARHTGHLATFGSPVGIIAPLCIVVFTAVKRHAPQHMCPQGVSVAFVGGKKHMGQVYSDRGSGCFSGAGEGATGTGTGGMVDVEVEVLGSCRDLIGCGSISVACKIFARLGLLT